MTESKDSKSKTFTVFPMRLSKMITICCSHEYMTMESETEYSSKTTVNLFFSSDLWYRQPAALPISYSVFLR